MIEIDIAPNLVNFGNFLVSWHGFFSFIAVAAAVYLVGRWAPLKGIDPDAVYSIAIFAIIGGIIGARVVHVVDHWGHYQDNPADIIAIWEGGIGLWGGILGGFLSGAAYALIAKQPVGVIADLTAPALLVAQTIGRLGDIVNGEHCARATDFILGFVWTNPLSDAGSRMCEEQGVGVGVTVQPVIAYEMIWNMLALLVIWRLRGRLRPDGMLFVVYLALYSVGRFMIQYFRLDTVYALGMQEAHFIALLVLAITIPILAIKARYTPRDESFDEPAPAYQRGTRAERRRGR